MTERAKIIGRTARLIMDQDSVSLRSNRTGIDNTKKKLKKIVSSSPVIIRRRNGRS